jgi:DUF4097 and DUF4098 domain-containing protein YvlB
MKQLGCIALAWMLGLAVQAQDWKTEPFMTKSLAGQNIRSVTVETSGGNISVQADSRERVEVFIAPNNWRSGSKYSMDELKRRLDEQYDFELTTTGGQLRAIAKPKKSFKDWSQSVNVSFRVYVSPNVTTKLNTSGGNVSLTGLNGNQDFTTSGGNLQLERLRGKIRGRTSGGNIVMKDLSEDIDLQTSGGNIEAEQCKGQVVINTSGGSLRLTALEGTIRATTSGGNVVANAVRGTLTARTSGGNIRMEDLRCALDASTSGGNIDVEFLELTGDVKLTNSSGRIDIRVPAGKGMTLDLRGSRISTGTLKNFSGTLEEDRVEGQLNGGGPKVSAKAGSGRINLVQQ